MSISRFLADLPLRRKLMLIVMVIVLVATSTTLLFLRQQAARERNSQFVQYALAQARLVAEYAVSPIVFDDSKGALELLAKLALDPHVQYVRIDNAAGTVFAEANDAGTAIPQLPLQAEQAWRMEEGGLHIVVPIIHRKPLGHLRAGFRIDHLQQAQGDEDGFLLLVLAGVIGLSYLLTLALQRIISTPLLELQRHATKLAESQDFSMTLKPPGRDEVGSLYRAFNHLLRRIHERENDILALNRSLESKVAERTHDLEIARDKADQASRSKSEFLANMSHEIRTPINAITGFTALALRTELNPRQAGYLDRIQTAAHGLLRIINDLLDFSKIEAGRLDMERIPFRLADVMDTVVASVETQAERKGLEVLVNVAPDVPSDLAGDPLRLGQVLTNLCNNAVKFTERGEIEVRVALKECVGGAARLLFSVRDTGIGLTEAQASRLFQPFSQADTSTTRKFGGTGLGLAISRRLVEMMDGRIWLESQPGAGTTFHFEAQFGLAPAPEASMQDRPGPGIARLPGVRLLVVEDNPVNQQLSRELLEWEGAVVQIADNGRIALEVLQQAGDDDFDAVLLDLQMPEMDGYEAAGCIRRLPHGGKLPLIAMTAHAMHGERERCIAAGMNDHVAKPIDLDLLISKLVYWIGIDKMARASRRAAGAPASHIATAADDIALPDTLPGINIAGGLQRCMGDRRLFRSLLNSFCRHHWDAIAQIRQHCSEGKRDEACFVLHRLKGAAANLNIIDVANACVALEDALHARRDDQVPALVAQLAEHLDTVMSGLGVLDNAAVGGATPSESDWLQFRERGDLRTLVQDLSACLLHNDTRAEIVLADLRALLTLLMGREPAWLAEIARSINELDYVGASRALEAIGLHSSE